MLAEFDGKPLLPHWLFDDYDEHLSIGDKTLPAGSLSWENFERFNAFFRCIKSSTLNEGELTKISEIHYGARLNGDVEFRNHHLRLDTASRQEDTRSTGKNSREWMVPCEHQTVDVRQHKHTIINAASAMPFSLWTLRSRWTRFINTNSTKLKNCTKKILKTNEKGCVQTWLFYPLHDPKRMRRRTSIPFWSCRWTKLEWLLRVFCWKSIHLRRWRSSEYQHFHSLCPPISGWNQACACG